jgi:histidyl-tRNA synthetase
MATSDIYRAPVGTKDVLGEESRDWGFLISQFARLAHRYNYDIAITPVFENFEVFSRLGEDTDVVTKEMYDFHDKGGRHIALRPEGTAGIVRAFAQNRPPLPFKAWYVVSNFRYERPQKGRLREHHQLGIEVLGIEDPLVDVEVIQFAHEFLSSCGLKNFTLSINSLGDTQARADHELALRAYFENFKAEFGEEFAQRVDKNPFRMLDTKNPEWRESADKAPAITDFLNDDSKRDFDIVKEGLNAAGIDFVVTPSLVRGLDYYTNTAFEFISTSLDAAQSTLCGGGRYDKLVAEMDGPETPGIGFGLGIERLLLAIESEGVQLPRRELDVFVVDLVRNAESRSVVRELMSTLRKGGVSVDMLFGDKSMKAAMKSADRSGARTVVLVGENELASGVVSVKNMESGEQREMTAVEFATSAVL